MSRSPLAYPLTRGIDADGGGAADLQTDVMRFMAILSLCLVAIFALVQSLPAGVVQPATSAADASPPGAVTAAAPAPAEPEPAAPAAPEAPTPIVVRPAPARPVARARETDSTPRVEGSPAASAAQTTERGFTLRFASDLALARLVARGDVAFYALDAGRARRLAVRESRMTFWDAAAPAAFHEMESATVPGPVVDALARAGADTSRVRFGVTLPRRMKLELDTLMHGHSGGALVIAADGSLKLEPS